MVMIMGNTQFDRSEGHKRRQRLLKVWRDSVDCGCADVDSETEEYLWVVPTHHITGQFFGRKTKMS